MEDNIEDRQQKVSEFNQAQLQILRLHDLWREANQHSKGGYLEKYRWTLNRIWVELTPDATSLDKEKYFAEELDLRLKIAIAQKKGRDQYFMALQNYEIFLRELEEKSGKGSKRSKQHEHM